jgi:predicted secreted hydrolase
MTHGEWLAARGERGAARDALAEAVRLYESQGCCSATRAMALAEKAVIELSLDPATAASDAQRALALAPPANAESFSRFTAQAWYATGLVREARGDARGARDAFATAAVQFAGSLGDAHPDTVRARAAIERAATRVAARTN